MNPRRRYVSALALAAGVVVALGISTPTAAAAATTQGSAGRSTGAAAPSPAPSSSGGKVITVPADQITFAIGTASGTTADGRPSITVSADPGDVVDDAVNVYNLGKIKGSFAVYAIDAVTDSQGGYSLSLLNKEQKGIGAWTTVGKRNQAIYPFTLAGGKSITVPFRISVPKDAKPGDVVGGVVVSSVPREATLDGGEQALAYATRLGVRTIVRVGGELRAQLEVSDTTSSFTPSLTNPGFGSLTVSWTVRNTGNVRLSADRSLAISGLLLGPSVTQQQAPLDQILPGDQIAESATFDDVFAGVQITTGISVTPSLIDPGPVTPEVVTATTSTWAISWIAILIISLLVAAVWTLVARLRARRRVDGSAGGGRHAGGRATSDDAAPAVRTNA